MQPCRLARLACSLAALQPCLDRGQATIVPNEKIRPATCQGKFRLTTAPAPDLLEGTGGRQGGMPSAVGQGTPHLLCPLIGPAQSGAAVACGARIRQWRAGASIDPARPPLTPDGPAIFPAERGRRWSPADAVSLPHSHRPALSPRAALSWLLPGWQRIPSACCPPCGQRFPPPACGRASRAYAPPRCRVPRQPLPGTSPQEQRSHAVVVPYVCGPAQSGGGGTDSAVGRACFRRLADARRRRPCESRSSRSRFTSASTDRYTPGSAGL